MLCSGHLSFCHLYECLFLVLNKLKLNYYRSHYHIMLILKCYLKIKIVYNNRKECWS